MGVVLRGPGVYVPDTVLSNHDLVNLVDESGNKVLDTSNQWIIDRTGMSERRISLDEDVVTLGIKAVRDLEQKFGGAGSLRDVDDVRLATNYHKNSEYPCYASRIAHAVGAPRASFQDPLAGCTGLVYGLIDAYALVKSGIKRKVLVGGVERLTDFTDYGDRNTAPLFGDGAGFFLVENDESRVGIFAAASAGSPDMGDAHWPNGYLTMRDGVGKKLRMVDGHFVAYDAPGKYLIMDGKKIFRFATSALVEIIDEVVDRGRISLYDVKAIIPHGANARILDHVDPLLRQKGFRGVMHSTLEKRGNPSTASTGLSYADAVERGIIKDDDLVLMVSFGAGKTYGALLFRAALH